MPPKRRRHGTRSHSQSQSQSQVDSQVDSLASLPSNRGASIAVAGPGPISAEHLQWGAAEALTALAKLSEIWLCEVATPNGALQATSRGVHMVSLRSPCTFPSEWVGTCSRCRTVLQGLPGPGRDMTPADVMGKPAGNGPEAASVGRPAGNGSDVASVCAPVVNGTPSLWPSYPMAAEALVPRLTETQESHSPHEVG